MKALQSSLARDVLADPRACEQLRTFLSTPAPADLPRLAINEVLAVNQSAATEAGTEPPVTNPK